MSVSRKVSILATHASANGGRSAPVACARAVVERVVRGGDDRDDFCHGACSSGECGQAVGSGSTYTALPVDAQVGVHGDRAATLLGDLPEQPGRPGQQCEAAQHLDRQAEVRERRPAHAGAVERQPAAEHLLVHAADRLEEPQVRSPQALLLGDGDQHRRPRVLHLVHRVPQSGDEAALLARPAHRREGQRVPARVVGGQVALVPVQDVVEVAAAVLGHPEEPGAAAEEPGGQGALERVGGGEVGEPGGDRGRGEAVVGQGDQHRLEDPGLRRRRPAHRHQPERQLTEPDLAHQVGGQVLAEQPDLVGGRGAERGGVRERVVVGHGAPPRSGPDPSDRASHRRRSAPCSSRPGGGRR